MQIVLVFVGYYIFLLSGYLRKIARHLYLLSNEMNMSVSDLKRKMSTPKTGPKKYMVNRCKNQPLQQ